MPGPLPNYRVPWRRVKGRPLSLAALAVVRLYQLTLAPFIGHGCRHLPTCSNYMLEAIVEHGLWRGGALGLRRISRCGPGGTCGADPVPPKNGKKPL